MSSLLIFITGKPTIHGYKRREFHWSPAHGVYLYGNKEYAPHEFNAAYEKAMKTNSDMNPRVKVWGQGSITVQEPQPTTSSGQTIVVPPAPISILEQVEAAEALLQRYTPEKLRKKSGAKPAAVEV